VTAARLAVTAGNRLSLDIGRRVVDVSVAAVLPTDAGSRARLDGLMFADIATPRSCSALSAG